MLLLFSISYILTSFISFFVGIYILYKNRESLLNKYWSLVSLSGGLWSLSLLMVAISNREKTALIWQYILDGTAIFIPIFFFNFVLILINEYQSRRFERYVIWGGGIMIFFLSFTSLFKKGVAPLMGFNYWIQPGPLYFLFPLFFSSVVLFLILFLIKGYKKSIGLKRNQIKFILLSAIIGFSGGPTNFFPQLFNIYPFGNFLVVFYIVGVAYAITRYRLMDIKVVLRKYSVYLATLSSILLPAFALKYYVNLYFPRYSLIFDFLILVAAVSAFPVFKNYYYRAANKYFFSSLYDEREVMADLSEKLKSTLEAEKIFRYISDTLVNSFHAKTVSVLIFNEKTRAYEVKYDFGHQGGEESFTEERGFFTKVIQQSRAIVVEEIKEQAECRKYKHTFSMLEKYDIDVLIPLNVKDEIIGLLALGPKESGDMYNHDDLRVLGVIGAQAAIAVENALLFQETKEFNVKLEKEIALATRDLRDANAKLTKLDQAKSEFISIASHQLRTPLTVIKGYVSMILEGSFGLVDETKQGVLRKVYESNERLLKLVENLLNISRIESGRMQYYFEKKQLEDIIADIAADLAGAAQNKGLFLNFLKPAGLLPAVFLDEEKIRQVITNLIDNAVKYTKEGGITITLEARGGEIAFCSADTGVGIRPDDLPNLFRKFSRGTDMSLVNPGGTGLGLYVARNIIEAHSGRIWAESEGAGQGSRFCFTIPLKHAVPQQAPAAPRTGLK